MRCPSAVLRYNYTVNRSAELLLGLEEKQNRSKTISRLQHQSRPRKRPGLQR